MFTGNLDKYSDFKMKLDHFIKYIPISEFPPSYRDLSFSVADKTKINSLMEILDNISSEYLIKSFMFDFFENKKTNQTKLGYRFIFQSFSKTLTDKEINLSIENILNTVLQIDSVSLPGRDKK